jgi:DNA uptake protein ComE-like DNA-binding protein
MIKIITAKEAKKIIEKREPAGLFFRFDKKSKKYIGIDNRTCEAWTEEFDDLKSCKKWLRGEE